MEWKQIGDWLGKGGDRWSPLAIRSVEKRRAGEEWVGKRRRQRLIEEM